MSAATARLLGHARFMRALDSRYVRGGQALLARLVRADHFARIAGRLGRARQSAVAGRGTMEDQYDESSWPEQPTFVWARRAHMKFPHTLR